MNGFRLNTVIGPQLQRICSERTTVASATIRRARRCIDAQTRRQSSAGVVKVTSTTIAHHEEAAKSRTDLLRWMAVANRVNRTPRMQQVA